MKKTTFIAFLMFFALSASTALANNASPKNASDNAATTDKKENRLSDEEVSRMTKRVEEIRDMDKSNLTTAEKRDLRKELKTTRENVKKDGGYIYIGAGTLVLIIVLVIILL